MTIDKAALRKETRWIYLCREVEVLEVSESFVVYCTTNSFAEVAPLSKFLAGAHDPSTFEHQHLLDVFGSWSSEMAPHQAEKLPQAISYILTRIGPPRPANCAHPAPAPEPASIFEEPSPDVDGEYVLSLPVCEPLPEDEDRKPKKRPASWRA